MGGKHRDLCSSFRCGPPRLSSRRCRLNTPAAPPNIIVRIVQTGRNIPYNHYIMVGHLNSTPFARHATEENRTVDMYQCFEEETVWFGLVLSRPSEQSDLGC
jgi:hypothetical protein